VHYAYGEIPLEGWHSRGDAGRPLIHLLSLLLGCRLLGVGQLTESLQLETHNALPLLQIDRAMYECIDDKKKVLSPYYGTNKVSIYLSLHSLLLCDRPLTLHL